MEWWFCYGENCSELQKFTIHVLSQACNGALQYGLRRKLVEKLLTDEKNCIEQGRLKDFTFVYYNLQLQNLNFGAYSDTMAKRMDPNR